MHLVFLFSLRWGRVSLGWWLWRPFSFLLRLLGICCMGFGSLLCPSSSAAAVVFFFIWTVFVLRVSPLGFPCDGLRFSLLWCSFGLVSLGDPLVLLYCLAIFLVLLWCLLPFLVVYFWLCYVNPFLEGCSRFSLFFVFPFFCGPSVYKGCLRLLGFSHALF